MKHFRSVIKFVAIGLFSLLLILALFPLRKSGSLKKAQADSMDAYPSVCLGGWENPGDAAGTPDVPPGGTSFTVNNSAVLNGEQAQIFCGSFQASDQSQTPASATLHFSWNVIFASQEPSSVSTDTDSSNWASVIDTTSSATSTPPVATSSTPIPAPTPTSTPTASSTPTPPPTSPPSNQSSDANQSSTSLLQNIFNDPFAFLIQRTLADSTDTASAPADTSTVSTPTDTPTSTADTSGDFIDVSYSFDGTTWTDLGPVSASDWQNYSVTIPVSSWDDINKLQIQLSPLLTPDAPTIYLDGMWLQVDYNQSLLGDLQNSANAAINALSDLSDTVNNALTDLLSPPPPSPTPQDTTNMNASSTPTSPPPPPPPQHQYRFTLQGAQSIKVGKLAWAPEGIMSSTAVAPVASQAASTPTVSLPATNTIQVSGSCSSAYYTILIFANPGDYESNPALAVYNEANKCVNGSFTQTISDNDLPPQLASGTYYLVVANQGTKGPWAPDPKIYPIELGSASSSQ